MTFTVTDLPAPLSPTSAVTCPGHRLRFTPRRARTAPNSLRTSSRRSSGSAWALPPVRAACELKGRLLPYPGRRALLLEAGAELRRRDEAVGNHRLGHVLGGDPDGREEDGGHVHAALGVGRYAVDQRRRGLKARAQEEGEGGGCLRLELDGLVDGAALVAGQYVLQTLQGGVLPGGREGVGRHVERAQVGDDGVGVVVVGSDHRVDSLVGGVLTLEGSARLRGVPGAGGLARVHEGSVIEMWLKHLHVALREEGGVVVGGCAAHHQYLRALHTPVGYAVDQPLADEPPHLHVVEADVVRARAAQGQAVVVYDRHAALGGVLLDGGAHARRDRVE